MRAAIYPGGGKPLTIEDVREPECGPDDIILKVHRCGICGTDLHLTAGHKVMDFAPGSTPGHEYAGEVVEVGRDVTNVKKGDLVAGEPSPGCGNCEACHRGNYALCMAVQGTMGGFGEYLRQGAKYVVKLPSTLSLADGALMEPMTISLNAVKLARLNPGDRVLVLGAGGIGLTVVYWLRRLGAGKIVVMSRSERRKDLALTMGADAFVCYGDNEVGEVREALGGPPDAVFECVGQPGYIAKSVSHVRSFGQVLSLGFCLDPDPIIGPAASLKAVSLQFPNGFTLQDFQYCADVMDKGHVDPKILISTVAPLESLPSVFDLLKGPNEETKVQITPLSA
jgi:(R,R)-butanediol dehydrogenase/meso-butanediol dehydrogenase/diacetyl reductase